MTYKPLILVAAPTRCGTTMITWLLHLHGAWIGEANITKAPETNPPVGTENFYVKQYLRSCGPFPHDFKEKFLQIAGGNEPWVIKTPLLLEKQELFIHNFPDARWILPTRPIEDIVASKMRHPGMSGKGKELNQQQTQRHISLQEQVRRNARFWMDVPCNQLVEGDIGLAQRVVAHAGLKFDVQIFQSWIQPERWHGS